MDFIIGVDGGGTKTEAIAYNLNGEELGRAYSGFGNLVVNKDEALKNILNSIETLIKKVEGKCVYICLGLAGVESGDNKEIVEEAIKERFGIKVKTLNDADIALSALLEGEDGILTIAGTGSISYGKYKEKSARAGGWGHLIGDEGSGYYLAINAFKNMALEEDKNIEKSLLTKEIMKELNIDSVQDIKKFIYGSTKAEIASITPIISKLADKGEINSINILKHGAKKLAETTKMVADKLEIKDNLKVGIKGSVLTKSKIVRETFEDMLKKDFKNIKIIDDDISSAKGAFYIALKEL